MTSPPGAATEESPQDLACELPDIGDLPLGDLLAADDSVLAHALRRAYREADHPEEIAAGWNSAV